MARGDSLGELEQIVLLALIRLGPEAYGVTIRREILDRTGRSITPGTIYPTLERLERKGYVRSHRGEATARRGGRAKRHYELTADGLAVVRECWRNLGRLVDGFEAVLEQEG